MFHRYLLTSLLVFAAIDVDAQVPHVFQPNQPARAAEVNENFTALANELGSVDGRLTYVEQNTGAGGEFFPVGQVQLPVGSRVTVGGTVYTIVQLRVPRFDTDETWLLRFPTSDPDLGGSGQRDYEGVSLYVTGVNPARPTAPQQGPYHTELNGFKAHIGQTLEYWYGNQGLNWSRSSSMAEDLSGSVTSGILSGTRMKDGYLWLRSDAAISPRKSGGPLMNANGSVVGISTAGYQASVTQTGLNLFMPIADALVFSGLRTE